MPARLLLLCLGVQAFVAHGGARPAGCRIAGADRQSWPCRSAWLVACPRRQPQSGRPNRTRLPDLRKEKSARGCRVRPTPLEVRERCCVLKRSADGTRAVRQRPNLKMVTPSRIGRGDSEPRCSHKTKATVEMTITKEGDHRLARRVSRADDCMHQRLTGSLPLMSRQDADRSQPECGHLTHPSSGARHMTDDPIVAHRHHRERRDPAHVPPQRPNQERLRRLLIALRSAKRGRDHRIDHRPIFTGLAPDDHMPPSSGSPARS